MMTRVRSGLIVVLLVGVVIAACGGSDGDGGDQPAPGGPVEIVITVDDDGVDAPNRPRIAVGSQVSLIFSVADPADAHLHGYDLWATVGTGSTFSQTNQGYSSSSSSRACCT